MGLSSLAWAELAMTRMTSRDKEVSGAWPMGVPSHRVALSHGTKPSYGLILFACWFWTSLGSTFLTDLKDLVAKWLSLNKGQHLDNPPTPFFVQEISLSSFQALFVNRHMVSSKQTSTIFWISNPGILSLMRCMSMRWSCSMPSLEHFFLIYL